MSQYNNLKGVIASQVYTNHNNEVTAEMVKTAMNAMTDSLGAGYQYLGVATPTSPGTAQTPDQKVFYIATTPGTYTYLGGLVVNDGEVAILKWDTAWHKEVTGAATAAQVTELGHDQEVAQCAYQFDVEFEEPYLSGDGYAVYIVSFVLISKFIRVDNLTALGLDLVESPSGKQSIRLPNNSCLCYDWKTAEYSIVEMTASFMGKLVLFTNTLGRGRKSFLGRPEINQISALPKLLNDKVDANVSVNLFNKADERIIDGYVISGGQLVALSGYKVSGPIPITGQVVYKCPHYSSLGANASMALCDEDGNITSYVTGRIDGDFLLFVLPVEGYVRVNLGLISPAAFMVCRSADYPDSYVPYVKEIGPGYDFNEFMRSQLPPSEIFDGVEEVKSVNLFDMNSPLNKSGYYSDGVYYENAMYNVTHPITVRAGTTYKAMYPADSVGATNNKIVVVNAENVKTGILLGAISGNFITFTPDEDCLVSLNIGNRVNHPSSFFLVAENSEYPEAFAPYYDYFSLPDVQVGPGNVPSKLYGKSVIFTGDSICAGASDLDGNTGWASRIGKKYKMNWINRAVSGGTIIDKDLVGSSFTISDTDFGTGADYIILEGGTNDADRIGSILDGNTPALFGAYNDTDYLTQFDNQTFCGAVEKLLQTVISSFPSAHVGFIIAPKMGVTNTGYTPTTNNRRAYFETIIKICKKWGVPVLNLWDECTMNPRIASHYSGTAPDANGLYSDGQHPTPAGYKLLTPIIEAWMQDL